MAFQHHHLASCPPNTTNAFDTKPFAVGKHATAEATASGTRRSGRLYSKAKRAARKRAGRGSATYADSAERRMVCSNLMSPDFGRPTFYYTIDAFKGRPPRFYAPWELERAPSGGELRASWAELVTFVQGSRDACELVLCTLNRDGQCDCDEQLLRAIAHCTCGHAARCAAVLALRNPAVCAQTAAIVIIKALRKGLKVPLQDMQQAGDAIAALRILCEAGLVTCVVFSGACELALDGLVVDCIAEDCAALLRTFASTLEGSLILNAIGARDTLRKVVDCSLAKQRDLAYSQMIATAGIEDFELRRKLRTGSQVRVNEGGCWKTARVVATQLAATASADGEHKRKGGSSLSPSCLSRAYEEEDSCTDSVSDGTFAVKLDRTNADGWMKLSASHEASRWVRVDDCALLRIDTSSVFEVEAGDVCELRDDEADLTWRTSRILEVERVTDTSIWLRQASYSNFSESGERSKACEYRISELAQRLRRVGTHLDPTPHVTKLAKTCDSIDIPATPRLIEKLQERAAQEYGDLCITIAQRLRGLCGEALCRRSGEPLSPELLNQLQRETRTALLRLATFEAFDHVVVALINFGPSWTRYTNALAMLGRQFAQPQSLDLALLEERADALEAEVDRRRKLQSWLAEIEVKQGRRRSFVTEMDDSLLFDERFEELEAALAQASASATRYSRVMTALVNTAAPRLRCVALYAYCRRVLPPSGLAWAARFERGEPPGHVDRKTRKGLAGLRALFGNDQEDDDVEYSEDEERGAYFEVDEFLSGAYEAAWKRLTTLERLEEVQSRLGRPRMAFAYVGALANDEECTCLEKADDECHLPRRLDAARLLDLDATDDILDAVEHERLMDPTPSMNDLIDAVDEAEAAAAAATAMHAEMSMRLAAEHQRAGIAPGDRITWGRHAGLAMRPTSADRRSQGTAYAMLQRSSARDNDEHPVVFWDVVVEVGASDAGYPGIFASGLVRYDYVDGTYSIPDKDLKVILDDDDAENSETAASISEAGLARLAARLAHTSARADIRESARLKTFISSAVTMLGDAADPTADWFTMSPQDDGKRPGRLVRLRRLARRARLAVNERRVVFREFEANLHALQRCVGAAASPYLVEDSRLDSAALEKLRGTVEVWRIEVEAKRNMFNSFLNLLLDHWKKVGAAPRPDWRPSASSALDCAAFTKIARDDGNPAVVDRNDEDDDDAFLSAADDDDTLLDDDEDAATDVGESASLRHQQANSPSAQEPSCRQDSSAASLFLLRELPFCDEPVARPPAELLRLDKYTLDDCRSRLLWWRAEWRDLAACKCCYELLPRSDYVDQNVPGDAACCEHLLHRYCRGCLTSYAQAALNDPASLVGPKGLDCVEAPNVDCERKLSPAFFAQHDLLAPDQVAKLTRFTRAARLGDGIARAWCPNNCDVVVDMTAEDPHCDVCQTRLCKGCRQEAHEGKCANENAQKDVSLAIGSNWQRCPACRVIVAKTHACGMLLSTFLDFVILAPRRSH